MLKFAIPAIAGLGLIAFAARSQATDPDVRTGVAPMGWHLSHEGDLAKLAYGVANSDQLALMMTCEPGAAQAVLYGDVKPVGPRVRKASMDGAPIDPLGGSLEDEIRLPVDDPSLKQLALRGKLAVEGDAGAFELTATRNERTLIDNFFAYCGNRQA
ncbi:MAG: hypothetical protein PSV23_01375 [Brevundimonas sp.]|uniref:hypothetical protein n=1 Tax=Brevundimonas sp. TaxID=1871086 RepID=UPI0024889897|nr:hypothetical protein [Brevundimonas sp.]MDI1325427.1 hypothetical protein [Brevundimonas sp.]